MRIRFVLPGAAAAVLGSLALAGPGLASPAPPVKSPYFAGYFVENVFPSMNLTSTIIVPKIKKCGHTDKAIVPAAGSSSGGGDFAALFIGCRGGKAHYYPIVDVNGNETDFTKVAAQPGDKVVFHVHGTSTTTTVSVVDKTRKGVSKSQTGAGSSSYGGPNVGDNRFNSEGVANFGTLSFSNTKLNGKPLGTYSPSRENLYNSTLTTLEVATSPFNGGNDAFKTVFKHS